ncbi:hypothetical protein Tco_0170002 [Tanacetum coccineum]
MQQFWYSIKKVQGTDSYEFLLANKKCVVNADVFRTIVDICPSVEGVDFTDVPDDTSLTFLIELGYKGPLYKHTNMFVDHMHQSWRTLAAIINKENVDYPELIWEDLAYQIDHRKEKRSRRENTEDYQEYGLAIPETQRQRFTSKKTVDDSQETVDVSEESEPEPECIGESSEGNGTILGVPDASTVISATSSEGTSTKLGVPDEEKDITEENVILERGSKQESKYSEEDKLDDEEKDEKEGDADDEGDDHISDTQDTDDEDDETESDEDDIYKYKIRVRKDEDVEMINAKFKAELPPTSSSLSVSSSFGDQFLKLSSDNSLVSIVKDNTDDEINSLLEVKIQYEVPHIQSLSVLRVPVFVISEPAILTLPAPELSKIQSPTVNLKQGSKKSASVILKIKREQEEKQKIPKYTIKSTDKAALKEYDRKSALYQTIHENKSFNRNPANLKLYHALIEPLIEDENAMDKGGKKTKRRRIKESESSKKPSITKETPKGKAPSKGSKTGKSASAKEPVEKPVTEVVMDDASEDVVRDDDQPQDSSKPKTAKTPNQNGSHNLQGFLLLIRNETSIRLYLINSNKLGLIKWSLLQKDPVTFNDLMATLIDFSKYVLNRLKIDNLTQYILLGPAYNLLKGTSFSSVKLEYHFQECFNALKDKLDWNNLEGDRYSFDLSKPLPLQGHPCHLTVAADYFFNNDLDYLKSFDPERISQLNKFSKHNVYSTKKILGFKEGDFVDLHLNDIEDMLLLVVQHKLFHLTNNDIVDFIMALRMFTRSLVIKKRVKDLQLELYTPSHKPPGVIYEDLAKQKRVMRADELYKFSDRMLKKVRDELRHRVCNFGLESNKEMPRK